MRKTESCCSIYIRHRNLTTGDTVGRFLILEEIALGYHHVRKPVVFSSSHFPNDVGADSGRAAGGTDASSKPDYGIRGGATREIRVNRLAGTPQL